MLYLNFCTHVSFTFEPSNLTLTNVVFEYKTSSKDLTLEEDLTLTNVVFELCFGAVFD
mgnify:CR=1 FL=1